jgi:PAS domain S-box-containing protein
VTDVPDAARPGATFLDGSGETGSLVAAHDWSRTSLGPVETWPQSLRTATALLLHSPVPMVLLWGEDGVMLYNDAYSVFAGARHPELLGSRVREGWPEVADFNDHVMKVVLAGGTLAYKDQELTLHRHGRPEQVWMDLAYSPVLDESGKPAGVLAVVTETTERVCAEREIRQERDRSRRVLDGMGEGFVLLDRAFRVLDINAEGMRLEQRPREEVVGRIHWDVWPGTEESELGRLYKRAMAESVPVSLVHRYEWKDGHSSWIDLRAYPVADGLAIFYRDVSEAKRAEDRLRASEEQLRGVVEGARDHAILSLDPERRITSWSAGAEATFGYTADEVLGQACDIVFTREDREAGQPEWEVTTAAREGFAPDVRWHLRKDGTLVFINGSVRPIHDAQSEIVGFLKVGRDETDRQRAEAALKVSEERFRFALEAAGGIGTWDWDVAADRVYASPHFAEMYGLDPMAATGGLPLAEYVAGLHPDDRERIGRLMEEAVRTGGEYRAEYRTLGRDGEMRWVVARGRCLLDEAGKPRRFPGVTFDITDRKRAETELRETSRRLDAILNNTREAVFLMDHHQHCVYANAAAEKLTGYRFEQMQGRPLHDVVHHKRPDGSHYPLEECPIDRAFPERAQMSGEELFVAPDGSFYPVAFTASPVLDDEGRPIGTVIEARGIAEEKAREADRRSAYERLAEETQTLETLNRTGAALAGELDLERVIQMVADAGVELTGAAFGAFFHNVLNEAGESYMLYTLSGAERAAFEGFPMPRATAVFRPTFQGEGVVRSEDILADARYGKNEPHHGMPKGHLPVRSYLAVPVTSRLGEVIGGLFFGHPEPGRFTERHEQLMLGLAGQAAVATDNARLFQEAQREIRERRRAQEQLRELNETLERRVEEEVAERAKTEEALRQAQKMEAVGQLTGGIAHDFNNLLTGIIGSLDMMQRRIAKGETDRIERYATTAITSANRAAALTHRLLAFSRRQPLDPKPVNANRLVTGMEELLRRTIGEAIRLEMVTAGGLWQTLCDPHQLESAILNLAINARDAMPDGGRLTIETCNAHLDTAYAAKIREMKPGQYICICVTDTGTGMSPDVITKAFDPFFTTKPLGLGTGLGLSMIYGFARQSEGYAKIYSEVGQGTTVKLYLPRHYGDAEEVSEGPGEVTEAIGAATGEVVVVVEDETAVRDLVTDVLQELGYRIVEAVDGPSGLKLLQSDMRVDLLVTDIGLPGLNGRQLADHARQHRPGLKVLFMTGYAENATIANGFLEPGMQMITKPFAIDALATRVRDMIEQRGENTAS